MSLAQKQEMGVWFPELLTGGDMASVGAGFTNSDGIRLTIRHRQMRRRPKPGLPRLFERPRYRRRNVIERLFGWLKEKRRLCTRYDKLTKSYPAMVTLACIERCLGIYFQTKRRM